MNRLRLVIGVGLLAAAAVTWFAEQRATIPATAGDGTVALSAAFAERANDRWLEATLEVVRRLPDDNDGSRHQRFIARTSAGQTVLIAHNIDLADPVPVTRGDTVRLRGVYEWNDRGGVIHWTHHDPAGRHGGGYIEHAGQRYR